MFKSLRWRLQVWYAVLLLTVLASFGGVVYGLHWQARLPQVDAELHRTMNAVMSQFRRLLPWPRRPRRADGTAEQRQEPSRQEHASPEKTNSGQPNAERSSPERSDGQPPGDDSKTSTRPLDARIPRGPGPLPQEFVQLFLGDEESRLYFVIWGRDGDVLQKSDSAPSIEYPNFHQDFDTLPSRLVRDRRADHIYREVITCVPMPRPPNDPDPSKPFDLNVLVGRSLEKDIAAQHQSGLRLIVIGCIILAAGILGGGWLSARAIRPIAAMAATAEAISAQNLSERISVNDTDSELGMLAKVLNGSFDRLQDAVERQRQFTADASHELRTPLSVIITNTELALSRNRSAEDYRAILETCSRASHRMRTMIDALLLLARFDSGVNRLKREPVDLELIVRDCVEMIQALAAERGIEIKSEIHHCSLIGDGDRLAQVVTNLLTNAIRYNVEGGSIQVTCGIQQGMAVVSVADTGIGIPANDLPLIFERFYQVDRARSPTEGSSGLGLSICKTIVSAHGGTILATSQLGQGTTVEVRLPVGMKSDRVRDAADRRMSSLLSGV